jgi:hypothetical protein
MKIANRYKELLINRRCSHRVTRSRIVQQHWRTLLLMQHITMNNNELNKMMIRKIKSLKEMEKIILLRVSDRVKIKMWANQLTNSKKSYNKCKLKLLKQKQISLKREFSLKQNVLQLPLSFNGNIRRTQQLALGKYK